MKYTNSWVEISKANLEYNLRQFKKLIGSNVKLMYVVKSNAYGHGLLEISKICNKNKNVDWFGVVNLEEALYLRKNKISKPILVLSYYDLDKKQITLAIKNNISLVAYNSKQIKYISSISKKLKKNANLHLKFDSGISRLGVFEKEIIKLAKLITISNYLKLEGIFTHYASAEETNQSFTLKQTKLLNELVSKLNIKVPLIHAACSAATLINKKYHLNLIRLGISLYGLYSIENNNLKNKFKLKPILSWKTKVIQVKSLKKGSTIGYGRTFKVKSNKEIAILRVGYNDGYDRKLSNNSFVLIKGKKCKLVGRVCMNLIMVDITGKRVKVGDEVILIGKQGKNIISADQIAKNLKTINYEVVTRINPLLKRIIK